MRGQQLESRCLLAGDGDLFRHNAFDPEDVNDDGQVTSLDALLVINAMGQSAVNDDVHCFTDVNNDGKRSALDALRVINRIAGQPRDPMQESVPLFSGDIRSIDGSGNNVEHPEWGRAGEQLIRMAEAAYDDGMAAPAGNDRPSARDISNALASVDPSRISSQRDLSSFVFVWGQFLDHDIDLTLTQEDDGAEVLEIPVPAGDRFFDPRSTGSQMIPMERSQFDESTGTSTENPREQTNVITAFIDASMVYGSDAETALALREQTGGRMLVTGEGLVPTDEEGELMAGDIRAGENISLTSMHALFLREHNRLADQISEEHPEFDDETIYQQARAIVIAEIQAITFNEFLPALMGTRAIGAYEGYDQQVNPGIATEFSTAAFRFGHSTVNELIHFYDNDGMATREAVSLADAFFHPEMLEETGIDSILKYAASSISREIDPKIIDALRNFLFGPPGAGGFDLASLNIERGRDHGLADYNSTREAYGLSRVDSFDQITSDVQRQEALRATYDSVDDIDLWVGLLAEDHVAGGSVGQLARTIITDQFDRLRAGDRFWYENMFQGEDLDRLRRTRLSDVIERNTEVEGLQRNVFFLRSEIRGRVIVGNGATEVRVGTPDGTNRGAGVPDVSIELLDQRGNVVATTITDSRGHYRFRDFDSTGMFQVRVAEQNRLSVLSPSEVDVLISSGGIRLRDVDFEVRV